MLNIPYEVQQALRKGDMRKNYKMKVNDVDPDTGERTYLYTIDNDSLVSESVKVDERMVTGKVLKFGLCEGSSLEFQYFDHPNINGKDVQVYCSVEYVDGNGDAAWYDIPMGWYTVDQCPMQWDTGIFKVTAYNKLKSKYLDAKANALIEDIIAQGEDGRTDVSIYTILKNVLNDYSIEEYTETTSELLINSTLTNFIVQTTVATDSQGQSLGTYWAAYNLTIRYNLDSYYDYYRYIISLGLLKGKIQSLFSNTMYTYAYDASTGWSVYQLEDYAKVNTVTSKAFGGSMEFLEGTILAAPDDYASDYHTNTGYYWISIPLIIESSSSQQPSVTPEKEAQMRQKLNNWLTEIDFSVTAIKKILSDMEKYRMESSDITTDITLRELQSAVYETMCQYGQLDRETDLFTGVELNQGGLYPSETLYPDDALYPLGTMEHPFPSTYSKLWTDTVGEQSFKYLIITYKAMENGQEVDKTLQRTVNADGTTNYNMSDNWLFRNLIWTAADVGDYADAMVLKMKDIRWFPFEMWCAGLPYVETGDAIEITDKQGNTHTSYVLTRTLDGIHNLQDTFINGELDIF